ncbi:MAG TPA: Cof-type HAD-IIB family hydrolase [Lachnospiraceae bacterium]
MIKLIAFDMDGTLLNPKKEITSKTKAVLKCLRERNIAYTICTGRVATMTDTYVRALDIRIPVITGNGAALYDPKTKAYEILGLVPTKEAVEIGKLCRNDGIDCCFLGTEVCYFTRDDGRIKNFENYNRIAGEAKDPLMKLKVLGDDLSVLEKMDIHKVLIRFCDIEEKDKLFSYINEHDNLSAVCSEEDLIDIMASGVSKGDALFYLMEKMALSKEEVAVFGDYYNDISMMKVVGLPIAMENGCEEIKEEALYVTQSNEEDGVAKAIELLILPEK